MAKLLISGDYPLIASPTLAKAYGMAAATFLQKLHYCLQSSEAKSHGGKKYWFHTYAQWVETLGFYSISTIKRIVSQLIDQGVLIVKKLSQSKWLQTNYYSINYQKLKSIFTSTAKESPPQSASPVNKTTDIAVAKETKAKPAIATSSQPASQGTSQPTHALLTLDKANQLNIEVRQLYHALLQLKVDIHYNDARLQQWCKYQHHIIKTIASVKEGFGGIQRYQWHTPEQLGLDKFTIEVKSNEK